MTVTLKGSSNSYQIFATKGGRAMRTQVNYQRAHLVAKLVIYVLYLLVGTVSIELNSPYIALVFGTYIWLFGVNCTAYLIEHLAGHQHQHNRI
jgi:hypothetical protein